MVTGLCQQLSLQRFGRGLPKLTGIHDRNVAHTLKGIAREEILSTQFEHTFRGPDLEKYKSAPLYCYHKG